MIIFYCDFFDEFHPIGVVMKRLSSLIFLLTVCFFPAIVQANDDLEIFVSAKHKEIAGYDVYAPMERAFFKENERVRGRSFSLYPQAKMKGAKLRGSFYFAKLNGADLRGADLRNTDFSGADFSYADLSGARFNDKTILTLANFYGCRLDNLILEGEVDFSNIRDQARLSLTRSTGDIRLIEPVDHKALAKLGAKVNESLLSDDKHEGFTGSFGRKIGKACDSWKKKPGIHSRNPSWSGLPSKSLGEISPIKKSPSDANIFTKDSPRQLTPRSPSSTEVFNAVAKTKGGSIRVRAKSTRPTLNNIPFEEEEKKD